MYNEYIEDINQLLGRTKDLALLDLIYQLLVESEGMYGKVC